MSQYEPKETFKLAAIRSITKGVKYNDLSFITGSNLNKLRKEEGETDNIEYVTSHESLASIRKKHDEIKRNRLKRQQDLENAKGELQKLKEEEKQYTGRKTDANELVKNLQKSVVEKRNWLEEATFENRSMLNMVHRIKHDKVVYDQRKYNLEKDLEYLRKQLNIVKREEHVVGENADRARKVYEKLVKQLDAENRERREHLANIQSSIQTRVELKEVSVARDEEILEIAERAMQDKDENEKNWKKLLSVHKFVSMVLRDKMQREMSKFRIVETAFKNIKIATGTADTIELVNKFLNKETVYGELLSKIADSEKKIGALKHEHDSLEKESRAIEEELGLFEITKKENTDLSKEFKQLDTYEEKGKRSELLSRKMFQWVLKQLRKIYKQEKGKVKSLKYGDSQVKQALEELFVWLETNSENADETYTDEIPLNSVSSGQLDLNLRVKDKTTEQAETEEADTAVNEEEDYVSEARNDLLKQNDKFMKELKRKAEALMRLRMEMAPKKKEEVPKVAVPPPPVE